MADAEWAYSRPLWVTEDGLVVPFPSNLLNADELELFLNDRNHIPSSCVVHRRSCLDKYGYWPEDIPSGGDWRYWIRIVEGGGRTNLACCPTPSVLHFNAAWRTRPETQMAQVKAAREIAACSNWWPATLNVAIPPDRPEQEVFYDLIRQEGYVERLRRDVTRVVDRLAWMQLDETPGIHSRLQGGTAQAIMLQSRAEGALAAAEDRLQQAREELAQTSKQLDQAREEQAQTREQLDQALQDLAARGAEVAQAQQDAAAAGAKLEQLQGELAQTCKQLDQALQDLAARGAEVAQTQQDAAAGGAKLEQLQGELGTAEERLAAGLAEAAASKMQLEAVRLQLAAVYSSTSWRWAAPLRALRRMRIRRS
jgi:predicted  nucleic acid-binding Zn-ribbon protein